MSPTAFFERPSDSLATARGARVRRLLLEQVRYALTTEPAALEIAPDVAPGSLTYIRGRVSITVGAIVVRLNQEGFTGSERLYEMRDGLAQAGQAAAAASSGPTRSSRRGGGWRRGSGGSPSPCPGLPPSRVRQPGLDPP